MSFLTARIGRIGRIGSVFQNSLKVVIRDDFKSCFEINKGVRIPARTTVSLSLKEGEEQDFKRPGDVMRNLDEIVKLRARYYYNAKYKSVFETSKPRMSTDWCGVEFINEPTQYQQINGEEISHVTSKAVLENKCQIDQQHKIKAERKTSKVCQRYISNGFTINNQLGLSLPVVKRNKDEDKCSMFVEDIINVPGKSSVTVKMISTEKEKNYLFTTLIAVTGNVTVTFYNKKEDIIGDYVIPMRRLVYEEFPPRMVVAEGETSIISMKGMCKCKYETDKRVIT